MAEAVQDGSVTAGCVALAEELPAFLGIQRELFDAPKTFTVLETLGALESGGEMRASELAQAVFLDPSTVTRQVAYLRSRGWVDTQADPDDGRAVRLRLTPAGLARLHRLREEVALRLQRRLGSWSEEEVTALAAAMHRYCDCRRGSAPDGTSARPDDPTPARGDR